MTTQLQSGLSPKEILRIVNRYIGVSGGYLGDFSYRTHADFYPEYCDLDINPYEYEGTPASASLTSCRADRRTSRPGSCAVSSRSPGRQLRAPDAGDA